MHSIDWIALFLSIPGAIASMIAIGQAISEFISSKVKKKSR